MTTFTRKDFPTLQIHETKMDADIQRFVDFKVERRTGEDNFCAINQELKEKYLSVLGDLDIEQGKGTGEVFEVSSYPVFAHSHS